MSRVAGGMLRFLKVFHFPEVGSFVRIHNSAKPLPGHTGTIIAVSNVDPCGPYLVEFEDGLQHRYQAWEFSTETSPVVQKNPRRGLNVLHKILRLTKSRI
jgi:hypothetical protein